MPDDDQLTVWMSPDRDAIRYRFYDEGPIYQAHRNDDGETEVDYVPDDWMPMGPLR